MSIYANSSVKEPVAVPFWGKGTSTLDWCEENYAVHKYIAEFFNTTTNFIFVALAFFGMYNTVRYGLERRFLLANAGIALIGIGSWFFHMTLLYEFQLLDELPMIYGTCILVYNIFEMKPKPKYGPLFPISLFAYSVFVTFAYLQIREPIFHQVSYALLLTATVFRSIYLLTLIPSSSPESVTLRHILFGAWGMFGLGFALWNIDNIACDYLKGAKRMMGIPAGYMLELHGWWHLLTGMASYFWLVFNQYVRLLMLGKSSESCVMWRFGAVPYVVTGKSFVEAKKMD